MVSLRFIVISSLLLFLIASTLLTVFHCKGENKSGFVATSDEKVRPKTIYVVAAAAAAREKTLRGRKMVVDHTKIMVDDHKKMKMNSMPRGKQMSSWRTTLSGNKNVNFVAYTEDYGKPKRHPPKNN